MYPPGSERGWGKLFSGIWHFAEPTISETVAIIGIISAFVRELWKERIYEKRKQSQRLRSTSKRKSTAHLTISRSFGYTLMARFNYAPSYIYPCRGGFYEPYSFLIYELLLDAKITVIFEEWSGLGLDDKE